MNYRDSNLEVLVGNPFLHPSSAAGRMPWPPYGLPMPGAGLTATGCPPAPGCAPCPPNDPALAQQLYAMQCNTQAAQMARASRAVIASQQPQITLGVRSELIAPGSIVTLTTTPSVPLCITDLDVSRVSSAFFLIQSMKTARVEFLADGQAVPAEVFSPDGIHPPLEWPYLMPGTLLTMIVENIDSASHRFFATFWGIPSGQYGPCL